MSDDAIRNEGRKEICLDDLNRFCHQRGCYFVAVDGAEYSVAFVDGNIVNHEAEGLVCSGNVHLNMSGGVNGELLHQGGIDMQRQLHDWLRRQPKGYVQPGFTMRIGPQPFAFKSIVYTVAVDAFYGTSPELVKQCLFNAFTMLASDGCRTVAVTALATGFGPMSRQSFGVVLKEFLGEHGHFGFDRIDVVCERGVDEVAEAWEGIFCPLPPECAAETSQPADRKAEHQARMRRLFAGLGVAVVRRDGKEFIPRADMEKCARQMLRDNIEVQSISGYRFDGHLFQYVPEAGMGWIFQPSFERLAAFLRGDIPDEVTHFTAATHYRQAASQESWRRQLHAPPGVVAAPYTRLFSSEEFSRIRHGFVPRDMDEHWFICFDDGMLHFYSSWSGELHCSVPIQAEGDGYRAAGIRFTGGGPEPEHAGHWIERVDALIDRCLLGTIE